MNNPQVANQIARLRDQSELVRQNAAEELGNIGNAAAVPALIEALNDEHWVRRYAAEALGKIGDAAAVPALIEALKAESMHLNQDIIEALGKIGDAAAAPSLLAIFEGYGGGVRAMAAAALLKLGNSQSLPRKILADPGFSAQERIDLLETLRRARYRDGGSVLSYTFQDTRTLCEIVRHEEDAKAREGAQIVLNWLNGDRNLVILSMRAPAADARDHLRASHGGATDTDPGSLLIAAAEPGQNVQPNVTRLTPWERLIKRLRLFR